MKRCPTCSRTYTDPNLSYCIEDGTPLTTDVDEDAPYRPPSSYAPPGAMPRGKQRRAWPWIVGLLGAFILGAVALMIAVGVFVPRMVRSRQGDPPAAVSTNETDQAANPADDANTPPPTDEPQVLAQLTDLENEWEVANVNADKKKLNRILADEYVGPDGGGGLLGKKEYINRIRRDTSIEKWEFADLKVDLSGDRATLTGTITLLGPSRREVFDFTDKFVWRNGRWQATGSEIHQKE